VGNAPEDIPSMYKGGVAQLGRGEVIKKVNQKVRKRVRTSTDSGFWRGVPARGGFEGGENTRGYQVDQEPLKKKVGLGVTAKRIK